MKENYYAIARVTEVGIVQFVYKIRGNYVYSCEPCSNEFEDVLKFKEENLNLALELSDYLSKKRGNIYKVAKVGITIDIMEDDEE